MNAVVPDGGVPDGGGVMPNADGGVVVGLDGGATPEAGVTMGMLVAEPTSLNLGTSAKNVMSAAMKVTLRNLTNQTSGTMQYSFVGGDAARFAMVNSSCAGQIEPAGVCQLFI